MKREIKFNSLYSSSNYTKNLEKLFANYDLFRQKHFSNLCLDLLKEDYPDAELMLTHSATGALEMIALALDIQPGDEVILPSYTFVSTANAFALRGAKLVFVDIEMDTLGIDPVLVEQAISDKTKAVVAVHYGGKACQIEKLKAIATAYKVTLIEDAAMAFGSKDNGQALGTFGDFGVVSFDITKHISATQGGLLIINNPTYRQDCHEIYHNGTNRIAFAEGNVPYYEWVNIGSKFQMPEANAAILQAQLREKNTILEKLNQLSFWYRKHLKHGQLQVYIHQSCLNEYNYHSIYLILRSKDQRKMLEENLKKYGVEALFHYIPLNDSAYARAANIDSQTPNAFHTANCLLRLPFHSKITEEDVVYICGIIRNSLIK